ncbi:MAG: translocation/assembly module TamB domain-containing protein [Myxococcota bacterium]
MRRLLRGLARLGLLLGKLVVALVVTVYLLLVRSFLFLLTLAMLLYFASATTAVRDLVQGVVADAIPGTITASSVQWGPFPGRVRVADVSIRGEHAEEIIRADLLVAEVNLVATATALVRKLTDPDTPLVLRFRSARVVRPRVRIDVDEEGLVGIERAFHIAPDDEPPEEDGPPVLDLAVSRVRIEDGTVDIDTPEVHLDIEGVNAATRFRIVDEPWMHFPVPKATARSVDVQLKPAVRPGDALGRLHVPVRDVEIRQLMWEGMRFDFRRITGAVGGGGRLFGSGHLDLQGEEAAWAANVGLDLPPTSDLVPRIFGDDVRGALSLDVRGSGDFDQLTAEVRARSPHMEVDGVTLRQLHADVGLEPVVTPDGRLTHRFLVQEAHAAMLGGRVVISPARWLPRWAEREEDGPARPTVNDFEATVRVEGAEPMALLSSPWLGLLPEGLAFLDGRVSGVVDVAGAVEERTGLLRVRARTGGLAMDDLDASDLPVGAGWGLEGGFELVSGPAGSVPPTGLRFHPVNRLTLHHLRVDSGGDRLALDGTLDLERGLVDARGEVRIADLGAFLRPLGVTGVDGALHLRGARFGGTFPDPAVRGRLEVDGARLARQDLGTVEARVDLSHGLLTVGDLRAETPYGRVAADGAIRLWRDELTHVHPRLPFTVSAASVSGVDLHRLLPDLGVTATVSLEASEVEGEAMDPVGTLSGRAELSTGPVRFAGERARRVQAKLRGGPRRLTARDIEIVLDSGDVIRGAVGLDKRTRRIEASVETRLLPFSAFEWFEANEMPFAGRVTADLSLEGTLDEPAIIGTVRVRDFGFDPVVLGDASFTLTPGPGGRVDISTTDDFRGLEILDGSLVELDGMIPGRVLIRARGEDADVFRLLPFLAIPDTSLTATALAELEILLDRDPVHWELRVDALPDDVALGLYDGEISYRNLSPLFLVVDDAGVHLGPTSLGRNLDDALTVCGTIGVDTAMDLKATGRVELEVARPLRELFSVHEGTLLVGADPITSRRVGADHCLPDAGDRILHITGTVERPKASGRIETVDTRLVPRTFGHEFRLEDGAGVLLRPTTAPGEVRVVLPREPEERLGGEMDDGGFELWGEIVLMDLVPENADLHLIGTDLFYSSAGEFRMTFNPDVTLMARNFSSDARRRLKLSGEVLITDGSFYKSFDRISQTLSGGTAAGGSLPLTEQVPWLADLTLDLHVAAPDFEIRSKFPFGDTELEARFDLRIRGTLDDPEVYDRIQLIPGGRIRYDVIQREFEIVQGTLDFEGEPFAPRVDIEAQTEVAYLALVDPSIPDSEEERQVTVSLRISGVPPALNIEYWSNDDPSFDQADLQSLILTGRPRDEASESLEGFGFQYDFGNALQGILESPIIEALRVRVGADQSVTTELVNQLGRVVRLRTRVVQETEETRVTAGFRFQITDRLSLEGNLQRVENATNPTQTYQARFKYRIPLD